MHQVLCVDDESLIREALTLFFERLGVGVQCLESGRACIDEFVVAHERYDLVLVNYDMPGMDGPEVVRQLRAIDGSKRIALTSAYPEKEVFRSLPRDDVFAFLRKPYTISQLRRFLQRHLPGVEPSVIALANAGILAGSLAATLRSQFPVKLCQLPEDVLQAAKRGFSNVVLWEVDEADSVGRAALQSLSTDGVPLVVLGSLPKSSSLESVAIVLPKDVSGEELSASIRLAVQGGRPASPSS